MGPRFYFSGDECQVPTNPFPLTHTLFLLFSVFLIPLHRTSRFMKQYTLKFHRPIRFAFLNWKHRKWCLLVGRVYFQESLVISVETQHVNMLPKKQPKLISGQWKLPLAFLLLFFLSVHLAHKYPAPSLNFFTKSCIVSLSPRHIYIPTKAVSCGYNQKHGPLQFSTWPVKFCLIGPMTHGHFSSKWTVEWIRALLQFSYLGLC